MLLPVVISVIVAIVFYQIGQLDDSIGTIVGFITGVLVIAANLLFPQGWYGLLIYSIVGLALLTFYKLLHSTSGKGHY